jgi:hypothetical protein
VAENDVQNLGNAERGGRPARVVHIPAFYCSFKKWMSIETLVTGAKVCD